MIQEVEGSLLRISTAQDAMRIISVGPIRARSVRNRIASGDFVRLPWISMATIHISEIQRLLAERGELEALPDSEGGYFS